VGEPLTDDGGLCTVADEPRNEPGPFDVHTIRLLAALMSRHDLSEIDLREGNRRVRLMRGATIVKVADSRRESVGNAARGASGPPSETAAPSTPVAEKPTRKLLEIKSELVGTFYSRANTDAEPYVKVGGRVTPATVVGSVEAMKLYNDVQAGCSGVIAEILVENQQPVEYDQVLFRVDPAG
jgi:acetyl-CoA carboxylase biotin carboxyl carrier protein